MFENWAEASCLDETGNECILNKIQKQFYDAEGTDENLFVNG